MTTTTLDELGLDGVFSCADAAGRLPGVLALGGSDGGLPRYFERLLAAERCACLALAYHSTPKTQPNLIEVPLERLEQALRWLRDHPRVAAREGRVALSRGDSVAHDIAAGDALEVDDARVKLLQDQPASGAELNKLFGA